MYIIHALLTSVSDQFDDLPDALAQLNVKNRKRYLELFIADRPSNFPMEVT
jgi:hypothetical protein